MHALRRHTGTIIAVLLASLLPAAAESQSTAESRISTASRVLHSFTADETTAIPAELLERARGIAVIPGLFRGGFILGGRRGRGILSVRTDDGTWSNPAFVTLTGGSVGWQFGGESTDLVLVFANENSVRNIATGKFTLGGDASAIAGPLGRQATMAVTFRAEVYTYARSRGLYAGAAFEGARLDIDEETGAAFYVSDARPLGPMTPASPQVVREFLSFLPGTAAQPTPATQTGESAQTFPLED